ncbi:DUF2971 domain-containing protein [Ruegeria sp. HKCCA5426]|uniref:DUF2971 domain-containing protein n=1 Tax=Ruegeria sp. HKCCA5426 TaxID=2682985 RepID=UPI001488AB1A|nr:DUF2971 domain-containing protein [Ruegeria sp. HKCCA5426]
MFYKFMGGTEEVILDVFDKAVVDGSIKFASALHCNDPFEFKFASVKPTRIQFDQWHAKYDPFRSADELENAWSSFSGNASDFNTNFWPRVQLMGQSFVLCLARKWNSHLMWAHYGASHSGFVVCYKPDLIDALAELPNRYASGDVKYSDQVPELRWFAGSQSDMLAPVLGTKSKEWAYEEEYRVIFHGPAGANAIFEKIDPEQVAGVILGARASAELEAKAMAVQKSRKAFSVERVTAKPGEFQLTSYLVDEKVSRFSEFL